jgi:hypothetical protein
MEEGRRLTARAAAARMTFAGVAALLVLAASACATTGVATARREATAPWPWAIDPAVADSVHSEMLSPSVRLHRLVNRSVPWTAAVLELDLSGCVALRSVKGGATGVGRQTTSALLAGLPAADSAIAAVNADFFSFAPAGVPTGAHVERGRVVTGPGTRPVFGVDGAGRPFITVLTVRGELTMRGGVVAATSWNRPQAGAVNVIDAAWGAPIDTAVPGEGWRLSPLGGSRYVVRAAGLALPSGEELLLVRGRAVDGTPWRLAEGDSVQLRWALAPLHPMEAVGGFPVLVRDSAIPAGAASAGAASFSGPNPRTAVGIGADGRRVLLVVIDGRRPGVTAGMTLQQTADLMRGLGAREALNLDGGGSSALVVKDAQLGRAPRLVTRPSDATGERAVGNALAVLSQCRAGSTR